MLEININALKKKAGLGNLSAFKGLIAKCNKEYLSGISKTAHYNEFCTSVEIQDSLFFKELNHLTSAIDGLDGAFKLCAVFIEANKDQLDASHDEEGTYQLFIVDFAFAAPSRALLNNSKIPVINKSEWDKAQKLLFKFGIYWKSDIASLNFNISSINPYIEAQHSHLCITNDKLCVYAPSDPFFEKFTTISLPVLEDILKNKGLSKMVIIKSPD